MDGRAPYIGGIGTGEPDRTTEDTAEGVGRLLAERGAVLICGGLGGVMEAACRGARSAGGVTVGILPGTERRHGNAYLDIALPTGMGEMRNALIVRASDALIAVAGEFGTLSEIAFALKTGVRVIGIDTWDLSKRGHVDATILRAPSPRAAVDLALGGVS